MGCSVVIIPLFLEKVLEMRLKQGQVVEYVMSSTSMPAWSSWERILMAVCHRNTEYYVPNTHRF